MSYAVDTSAIEPEDIKGARAIIEYHDGAGVNSPDGGYNRYRWIDHANATTALFQTRCGAGGWHG